MRIDNLNQEEFTNLMKVIRLKDIQTELDGKKKANECLLYLKKYPQRITKQEFVAFCKKCIEEPTNKKHPMVIYLENTVKKYYSSHLKSEIKLLELIYCDKQDSSELTEEEVAQVAAIQQKYEEESYPIPFEAFCKLCYEQKIMPTLEEEIDHHKQENTALQAMVSDLKKENEALLNETKSLKHQLNKAEAELEKSKVSFTAITKKLENLQIPLHYETILKKNDLNLDLTALHTLDDLFLKLIEMENEAFNKQAYLQVKKIQVLKYTICQIMGES